MIKTSFQKYIPYTILPIAIASVRLHAPFSMGNTAVWWIIFMFVLFIFSWEAFFNIISAEQKRLLWIIKLYLAWNIISIVRGIFAAEDYWHYKNLISNGMTLLMPVLVYIAINGVLVQKTLSFYIRITLPFALLIFPFLGMGAWGWYLYPITLLMLFYPELPLKGKIIVIVLSLVCILGDLGVRSHVIKYSMPIILLLVFYYPRHFMATTKILGLGRLIMLITPFVLFSLAVSNVFNIFKMDEYIEGDVEKRNSEDVPSYESNLKHDTRTFLYEEVLATAHKYNSWILGRTPARGNETVWFADEMIDLYGRPERPKNEAGILNVFTWTGIVGLVLFFLVFYNASYVAIYRSRNIYAKLLGLLVAFRWFYSWIEDAQSFDANNFALWLMIGLCFSSSFRAMTNFEIKIWLLGIFKKEYFWIYNYYLKENNIKKTV